MRMDWFWTEDHPMWPHHPMPRPNRHTPSPVSLRQSNPRGDPVTTSPNEPEPAAADGYLGMTLIPRRGGRKAGLDHFGIEVEDLEKVRAKVAKKYPDIEIVKRPGNRPFASYSAHDPAGNYFDLSQPGHENRAEVYAKSEWRQDTTFSHFALRAREAQRVADFYVDVFELEARNAPTEDGGYHLTDGRVTMD